MSAVVAQPTLAAAEQPAMPGGAPPGAPPQSAPFQGALEAELARTATAEGHQQEGSGQPSPAAPANPSAAVNGEVTSTALNRPAAGSERRGVDDRRQEHREKARPAAQADPDASTPSVPATAPAASGPSRGATTTSTTAAGSSDEHADARSAAAADSPDPDTIAGSSTAPGAPHADAIARAGETADIPAGEQNSVSPGAGEPATGAPVASSQVSGAMHADHPAEQNPDGPAALADSTGGTGGEREPLAVDRSTSSYGSGAVEVAKSDPSSVANSADESRSIGAVPDTSAGEGASLLTDGSRGDAPVAPAADPPTAPNAGPAAMPSRPDARPAPSPPFARSDAATDSSRGANQAITGARPDGAGTPPDAHRASHSANVRTADGLRASTELIGTEPAVPATTSDNAAGSAVGAAEASSGSPSSASSANGPLLGYGVGLQQAIESIQVTIELAARQGLSQARIALRPEELGEIRIHLTQTNAGLVARVTAESPAAAQALAAGHAELRQSLSSMGLSLARLHIGHEQAPAGSQQGGDQSDRRTRGETPAQAAGTSRAGASEESNADELQPMLGADEAIAEPSALSAGGLIDLLV